MSKEKKFILILLIAGFILRLGIMVFTDSISNPEVWEYEEIANNYLEGRGFYFTFLGTEYRNTGMVLYPLMCIAVYYLTHHSFLILKIVQVLMSLFSCFLIYRISKCLFSKNVAVISLGLALFHPGLAIYSVRLHPLTLDVFLFVLFLYFFLQLTKGRNSTLYSILSGLSMGAALLSRATIGLFIFPAFIIIFLVMKRDKLKFLRTAFGLLIGLSLVLVPLMIRKAIVFNKIVVFPNDSGFQFWIGNNANSTGTANTIDGKSIFYTASETMRQEIEVLDEFGQKKYFYDESIKFVKDNPKKALTLFIKKIYYFWWFTPTQGLNYPGAWFFSYRIYYSIVLLLAAIGFLVSLEIAFKHQRQMVIYVIALFCITICIAQAIYYVDGRHRWAIEPFILIFTAYGITCIWNRFDLLRIRAKECLKIKT